MAFVSSSIDSVVQLEMLLLLFADATSTWTAEAIARELRVDPSWVGGQLDELCQRSLLTCKATTPPSYQYQPATEALHQTVADLARAYADRRVTIISLIYSRPTPPRGADPLKSFSEAFRLRKDRPHG